MELSLDSIIERYIQPASPQFKIEPILTSDFLHDLKETFQKKCAEKGLFFHMDVLSGLPEVFDSDEDRAHQIFNNLLSNSLKHTEKGGILLKVFYSQMNRMMIFDIIDSGGGIDEKIQPNLFDIFQIGAPNFKPGWGFGLPWARNLARGLNGEVRLVRSYPGEGAWFRVEIKDQN